MAIEVGKDVVAIRDHSQGRFKQGQIFTCLGLRESNCKCPSREINIGSKATATEQICRKCNITFKSGNYTWFCTSYFRALDDITPSIEEIIKEIAPLELVNNQIF
jgi:hypothetical protein